MRLIKSVIEKPTVYDHIIFMPLSMLLRAGSCLC